MFLIMFICSYVIMPIISFRIILSGTILGQEWCEDRFCDLIGRPRPDRNNQNMIVSMNGVAIDLRSQELGTYSQAPSTLDTSANEDDIEVTKTR